ncbi:hypothetical protein GSI_08500 [Ganoderma sinense ZZ0214-1]|uniref:Uncharacterized protein n=1 Tax=Ganoderma sinense ZZ0214-1 TaxID=1077348 RepID=A0A2G8S3W7_9APHY|nr:hypothetical protein GSI_08500 [Ganoderma sinense ZZ0214-1]
MMLRRPSVVKGDDATYYSPGVRQCPKFSVSVSPNKAQRLNAIQTSRNIGYRWDRSIDEEQKQPKEQRKGEVQAVEAMRDVMKQPGKTKRHETAQDPTNASASHKQAKWESVRKRMLSAVSTRAEIPRPSAVTGPSRTPCPAEPRSSAQARAPCLPPYFISNPLSYPQLKSSFLQSALTGRPSCFDLYAISSNPETNLLQPAHPLTGSGGPEGLG